MVKKIADKIIFFEKAIKTVTLVLQRMQSVDPEDQDFVFFRDSLIQRFEYCTDMFWKLLREYIIDQHALDVPASPKMTLKQAFELGIIDESEYTQLVACVNDRNLTSHAYHEDVAERIASHIQSHYYLMHKIVEALKSTLKRA